jgi:hypothetical protein
LAYIGAVKSKETCKCSYLIFCKLTGSFEWAYDKVAGVQRDCWYEILTRNNSDINETQVAMDQVNDEADEIVSFICAPFDCNGHGECVNGNCNCDPGLSFRTIMKLFCEYDIQNGSKRVVYVYHGRQR